MCLYWFYLVIFIFTSSWCIYRVLYMCAECYCYILSYEKITASPHFFLHWIKIQDRITYTILMLIYKSYYNIAPTYLYELISRRESSVNTRLGADHHQ